MHQTIPWLLLVAAAVSLLGALYAIWRSLTAAFGAGTVALGATELAGSDRRRALLLEKDALLRSLKDLEFERDAGKIGDEDFGRIERKLRARAKQVLVLLDEEAAPFRAEAEALLAKHLAEGPGEPSAPSPRDERAPSCAACGTANDPDAAFCKKCGAKLERAAAEEPTK